jgi:hypothetical protein
MLHVSELDYKGMLNTNEIYNTFMFTFLRAHISTILGHPQEASKII